MAAETTAAATMPRTTAIAPRATAPRSVEIARTTLTMSITAKSVNDEIAVEPEGSEVTRAGYQFRAGERGAAARSAELGRDAMKVVLLPELMEDGANATCLIDSHLTLPGGVSSNEALSGSKTGRSTWQY